MHICYIYYNISINNNDEDDCDKKSNNNINSFSRQDGKLNVIATFFVNYFS